MTLTSATDTTAEPARDDIAIIGMAGRFPGAWNVGEFWRNLRDGVESVVSFTDEQLRAAGVPPEEFGRPDYVRSAPGFEGVELFDAGFFGYTPREAAIMDPQHRWFLETAWEALEDAGYDTARHDARVGVFGGSSTTAYLANILSHLDRGEEIRGENYGLAFELAYLTSKVSHKLDLTGPSFPVQTACSTGLVALHLACRSLLDYECDMALSGAVAYKRPEHTGYRPVEGGFLSPDGHCRPFDAQARGTVFGNGVGMVVLKRLEDALADGDTVRAVIKGSAVNNDGAVKSSFTGPGVTGQSGVVAEALAVADVPAASVDYVEAHGSGTVIGDAIEVQALSRVFAGSAPGSVGLGSVKGNVGHLDAAAGIAGLVKCVLALEQGVLPASVNLARPNADIDRAGPFRVVERSREWSRTERPRRAGVSAFGFGGTNAHVVLEEAPPAGPAADSPRGSELLVLSARTEAELDRASQRLAGFLREDVPSLADTAFTLAVGRRGFPFRRAVISGDTAGAAALLTSGTAAGSVTGHAAGGPVDVVFLLSGQGPQHPGMGRELYEREPVFRAAVDACATEADRLTGGDLRALISGQDPDAVASLARTEWAQPALFTVEYALARLWESWGVVPSALVGHSLGELTAACLAGVFSLPDAVSLVVTRGRLMQTCAAGAMCSVRADRRAVEESLPAGLSLAAHNGPGECVVSGPADAVDAYARSAAAREWSVQMLPGAHAFHSALMEPVAREFARAVGQVARRAPGTPFVSGVTGTWITPDQACDPEYWGRQIRGCVEFDAGVRCAAGEGRAVVVEVGPGQSFAGLARRVLGDAGAVAVTTSLPHRRDERGDMASMQRALGQLWTAGIEPDWDGYFQESGRRRVPLPTYPFTRTRHWLDELPAEPRASAAEPPHAAPAPHPLLDELVLRTMDQSVFRTGFALERHWVLAEHKVLGEGVVPGTTYLEMARSAGSAHFSRPVTEILDVIFMVPLMVQEGQPRTAHTTIRERDDDLADFTVASQDPVNGRWTLHAQGSVSVRPNPVAPPRQDVEALRASCRLGTVDIGKRLAEHPVMSFGGRWSRSLGTVGIGLRAALGRLDMPGEYHAELPEYPLHPVLLDLATGFGAFSMMDTEEDQEKVVAEERDFYLPVGYDALRVHAPLPPRGLSFIRPCEGYRHGDEVRKVDIVICDDDGATAAEITGFTVKRVNDAPGMVARLRPHTRHHVLRWNPLPDAAVEPSGQPRRMLVVGEPGSMAERIDERLRARGVRTVTALIAGAWAETGDDRYEVPPTAEGFTRLLDAVGGDRPDEVLLVAGPADRTAHLDPVLLAERLDGGVHGLFHLVQCLSRADAMPARLSVVAPRVARVTGDEGETAPVHAALFAVAGVVGLESADTGVLCVDVADDTDPDAVCDELSGPRTPSTVALRNGLRYAATLASVDLERPQPQPGHPDGTYLITGGLGGLGLAVAQHLSRAIPGVALALLGRTRLPPSDQWDDVPADGSKLRRQIDALRELAANGARVRTYSADVTDARAMTAIVTAVERELGGIGCVVHAAGVAGDGFLFRKDQKTFDEIIAPKVIGAAVLDLVTRQRPPELMVNFGSTVSVFGTVGQSDYTAGNSYLDHYADFRTAEGRRTVTIDWTDWLGTGMAHDYEVEVDRGFFRSVSIEDGVNSFDEILFADEPCVIVGEINYPRLGAADSGPLRDQVLRSPVLLDPAIQQGIDDERQRTRPAEPAQRPSADDGDGALRGRDDGEYSDTERRLAHIWTGELGLTELSVYDDSLALGMDSLQSLRIAQRIQKAMDMRVSMVDLFQYTTIADLAAHLEKQKSQH